MARDRTQYRMVPYREKRKDRRVVLPPLLVSFDGGSYETSNWSLGGFLLEGCPAHRAYGETVTGTLGWEGEIFPFAGRVTRHVPARGELAVSFERIGGEALVFLDSRLRAYLDRARARP